MTDAEKAREWADWMDRQAFLASPCWDVHVTATRAREIARLLRLVPEHVHREALARAVVATEDDSP